MATSKPQTADEQTRLVDDFGVHTFELGDLIREGPTGKLSLRECPLCAADPERPRHHFRVQESRAFHIYGEHDPSDIPDPR